MMRGSHEVHVLLRALSVGFVVAYTQIFVPLAPLEADWMMMMHQ